MPRVRVGAVLLIPPPLATEIDGIRRGLADPVRERIAPHITLVPPVNVRDDDIELVHDQLRVAAARQPRLRLRIGPAASFAPVSPVAYLQVRGVDPAADEALAGLRADLLAGALARRIDNPFVPHVTVGDELDDRRLDAALRTLAGFEVDLDVDRVHLLVQQDDKRWVAAVDAPLGAAPVVVGRGGLPIELEVTHQRGPGAWQLLRGVGDDSRPVTVTARRDGRVVGVTHGRTAGGVLSLAAVAVAEGERRQGIGRHLLAAVEAEAADRGCGWAVAEVPDALAGMARPLLGSRGWQVDAPVDLEGAPTRWTRRLPGG